MNWIVEDAVGYPHNETVFGMGVVAIVALSFLSVMSFQWLPPQVAIPLSVIPLVLLVLLVAWSAWTRSTANK